MNVLFLTHRLPYAPNRGDRIRAFHIVESLRAHAQVRIASLVHSVEEQSQAAEMRARGIDVRTCMVPRLRNRARAVLSLAGRRPLTHVLLDASGFRRELEGAVDGWAPDVVLAYCSGMARFALEPPLNAYPVVIDLVDVDSEKWRELATRTRGPLRWIYAREARLLSQFERFATEHASSTLVVNERERRTLNSLAPAAHTVVVQNGIDLTAFASPHPPSEHPRVVFCGVMNYEPNTEGVLWFARHVWPLVRAERADATFAVVGADPTPAIRALASSATGIEVTGTVPAVQEQLWRSAVSVAPLRIARGLQNKVLEALAAGLPTVITSQVAEGLPGEASGACSTADAATPFANAVLKLLALTAAQRRELANKARLESLTWDNRLGALPALLEAAATRSCATRI